jgi:PEP-CTERM motif
MAGTHSMIRFLTGAALAGAAVPALAASISWSTGPTFNGPTGHEGILTNGTLVEAINLRGGSASTVTVDPSGLNLSFEIVDSPAFNASWSLAGTAGSSDSGWGSILNTFEWQQGSNVTATEFLSGLTVGNTYQVQFFAARTDCCGTRTATFGDGAGNLSAAVRHDSYTSVVGSFVASASTQTIQFIDSTNNPILNAYVLRDLTAPIPEPGTWVLMAAGLLAVGALVRRRG